jgi:hypothetical protein
VKDFWSRSTYGYTYAELYNSSGLRILMSVCDGETMAEASLNVTGIYKSDKKFRKSGNVIAYDEMVAQTLAETREMGYSFTEADLCPREDWETRYDHPVSAAKTWCLEQAKALDFTLTERPKKPAL